MGQRGFASLIATAAVAAAGASCAQAATITVNTTTDTYGLRDPRCSLRDAVQAVDTQAKFGACVPGTGSDKIVLPADKYKLTITPTGSDPNSSGDLNVTKSVTIDGAGAASTTINAGKIDRIFHISASGAHVTISGLTLTHGQALKGADGTSAPTPGSPGDNGGAILNAGTLTLTAVKVLNSTAGTGGTGGTTGGMFPSGASGGAGGSGGAIYSTGALTLKQVTMTDDTAGTGGGGGASFLFDAVGGPGGNGGAIDTSASSTVTGGTFLADAAGAGTGGAAGGGGGAINAAAALSVSGATFYGDAGGPGSASILAAGSGGGGGAIDAAGATKVVSSKFSFNNSGTSSTPGVSASPLTGYGGAILASGKLTLQRATFTGNFTAAGPSSSESGGSGYGGAVEASNALSVSHSMFTSNATGAAGGPGSSSTGALSGSGGAIYATGASTIADSTFTGNATGPGGSDSNSSSTGGSSGNGGAISTTGALIMSASTLTSNTVGNPGTGTSSNGAPGGGDALYVNGSSGSLVNDTLTGNGSATALTGAAYFDGSVTATLKAVTDAANKGFGVVQNGSSTVTFTDTLLSANTPQNCSGTITDGGHNLSFPATDTSCPSTFSHSSPKLASALANNGGPTKTLALKPGSAAINAGPAKPGTSCPKTDQRGMLRPQGPACDIGAFEFAVPSITVTVPAAGAKYKQGQVIKASYRCTEGGRGGFIASCKGPVASGKPIATSATGKHTFTVTAIDLAGNKRTKTVTYTVTARTHKGTRR